MDGVPHVSIEMNRRLFEKKIWYKLRRETRIRCNSFRMTILNVSTPLQSRSQEELLDPSIVELLFSEVLTGQYFNISLVTILVYHSSTSLLYPVTETEDLTIFPRIIVITLDKEVMLTARAFQAYVFIMRSS